MRKIAVSEKTAMGGLALRKVAAKDELLFPATNVNDDMNGLSDKDGADLEFIALAMNGKKAFSASRFGKNYKMVDEMVALLKT
eukprot:2990163-Heterocapsa_arctica.AAC.1